MPVKHTHPLLNILDRVRFTEWLESLADRGEVAGKAGDMHGGPIDLFVAQVIGWEGRAGRYSFFSKRGTYQLPGWAIEFQFAIDREPLDYEDNGSCVIAAERCLEILGDIP